MTRAPSDRPRLGWQYAMPHPDPGPPPPRPTPPDAERLNPEWAAAQRREETRLNRPLLVAALAAVAVGLLVAGLGAAGLLDVLVAGLGVICCALIAAVSGAAIWQGERALRSRLAQERARVEKARAAQESQLFAWQAEHARRVREWQALRVAHEHQKRWYAVRVPDGIQRVDIAGGTLCGWSAALTTVGASRLAAGGEVTVIDLTEGSVALDLIGFARTSGIEPLIWVLPEDLPRLDLGLGLGKDAMADVLSQAASVSEADNRLILDNAILERIIEALGGTATVASIAAALRALAQVGDPRDDVASGLLSAAQVDRLGVLFGRGATDRAVLERAWVLESRLRRLAAVGAAPAALPRSALRVVALGEHAGAAEGRMLAAYLAAALTHALRGTQPRRPWQHTLVMLGADRVRGDTLDRLCDVCESTGTGLVLAFRAISPQVGRGRAAVAFMRAPNAGDAQAATEQLGAGRRLVLSQLTETIGLSVTDTTAGSYPSTAGTAAAPLPASEKWARGTGSLLLPARAPAHPPSTGDSPLPRDSTAIGTSTSWGTATAKAAGDGESLARAVKRSREILVDRHELEQLPASAMIISYAGPSGREVVLADANPGIGGLAAATELTLEEFRGTPAVAAAPENGGGADAGNARQLPNVGPPPPRPDWRRRRS